MVRLFPTHAGKRFYEAMFRHAALIDKEEPKGVGPVRQISAMGHAITIHGDPLDPYYRSVEPDSGSDSVLLGAVARLPPRAVCLDVGANIGVMSVAIGVATDATVFAFEPDPQTYPKLVQNIFANHLSSVHPINSAVGASEGELVFHTNEVSGSASHLVTTDTIGQTTGVRVPVVTLDRFVRDRAIERLDLIKIDVEGYEIDVLRGASETLSRFKPTVVVEFNPFTMIAYRNLNPRELLELLLSQFPFVYRNRDQSLERIVSEQDALGFIHDNIVLHGCVDDLLCSFNEV